MISRKKNGKVGPINHRFDRNYGLVGGYEDGGEGKKRFV